MIFNSIIKKCISFIFTFLAKQNVAEYKDPLHVNFRSKFTCNTHLGANCHFNGIVISGHGKVKIGDNFHSGKRVRIITSNHNYEGTKIPYDSTMISKDVTIDDNVWIGEGVYILPGAHICEGAIIQAGSVVVSEIPYCAIAGGAPAHVFGFRDKKHYEQLKKEQMFF